MKVVDFKVESIIAKPDVIIPPGVRLIGAEKMWPLTKGQGVVIAIIDTGIDLEHPDLKLNLIGGRNFVPGEDPNNIQCSHPHGVHVAGTICANGRIMGVAPHAKYLVLKVFGKDGNGSNKTIADAFRYAVNWRGPHGERVDIINASLGGPSDDWQLHEALKYAVLNNILCCCAAGNEGDSNVSSYEIGYPAMYQEALSIGAIDFNGKVAMFSNSNPEVDIAAPGDKILSCYPGGAYAELSGTSMATPHVAGMAALYISKFKMRFGRKPTENELYILLKSLTMDIDQVGIDANTGAGLVQPWL